MIIMNLIDKREHIKDMICDKLTQKVSRELKDDNVKIDNTNIELVKERNKVLQLLKSAKNSKQIFEEIIRNREQRKKMDRNNNNDKESMEVFEDMKKEYCEMIVRNGDLDKQVSRVRNELHRVRNSQAKLREEIQQFRRELNGGDRFVGQGGNPWQIGVPYGGGGERRRFNRERSNGRYRN